MLKSKARRGLVAVFAASALFLGACGSDAGDDTGITFDSSDNTELYKDLNGNEVDRSGADNADVKPEDMNQISDAGEVFSIDSVGLTVPLGTVTSYNGIIEPVNYTSAFVVSDYSPGYVNPDEGAVVVVAHALDYGGLGPGNYVFDTATGQGTAQVGDHIQVGNKTYEITDQKPIPKAEIPNIDELWNDQPDMMHFITCVPNKPDNFVISAKLVK